MIMIHAVFSIWNEPKIPLFFLLVIGKYKYILMKYQIHL